MTKITEGELLPFKGNWYRLHITKDERIFAMELVKPTAKVTKKAERTRRWAREHHKSYASLGV